MKYFLLTWVIETDRQREWADSLPIGLQGFAHRLFYAFADATLPAQIKRAGKALEAASESIFIDNEEATCYLFATEDESLQHRLSQDPYVVCYEISERAYEARETGITLSMTIIASGSTGNTEICACEASSPQPRV